METKERGFSEASETLINRMAAANLRTAPFDTEQAVAAVAKAYDAAGLEMPGSIIILDHHDEDIFWATEEEYGRCRALIKANELLDYVRSRYTDREEVDAAWKAWVTGPARAARADFIMPCASSADYDFDRYIASYEFCQATGHTTVVEEQAFEILEHMLEAREAGLGYINEGEDTVYLIPAATVKLDDEHELSSETGPAILWADGTAEYYLNGASLDKELWESIVSGTITRDEIAAIRDPHTQSVATRRFLGNH